MQAPFRLRLGELHGARAFEILERVLGLVVGELDNVQRCQLRVVVVREQTHGSWDVHTRAFTHLELDLHEESV